MLIKNRILPWQLLTVAVLALPTAYLAYVWPSLPAQVPTHFTATGVPDGYTSRGAMWLLNLAFPVGFALLVTVLPHLDPKHRFDGNTVNFQKLRLTVVALISSLLCFGMYLSVHPGVAPGRWIPIMAGVFSILLGNYITTVQPNYFMGIRTPWTLESPVVWARTHRVGGMAMCAAGLLLTVLAPIVPATWVRPVMLVLLLGPGVFCYAYSYVLSRQLSAPTRTM